MSFHAQPTIAAIATPPGAGGVGIIRISGPDALAIAQQITKKSPQPRHAHFCKFYNPNQMVLDEGVLLYFPGPNSYTGEDVIELQGHGSPVVLDSLLDTVVHYGGKLAQPGEFTQRAFLNDKIDLLQAEAIADLIDASSREAASSAMNSLSGKFSKDINHLAELLVRLRVFTEASLDFPDEDIEFIADAKVIEQISAIEKTLADILRNATQGVILRDGMKLVLAGLPNAGKSTLLNCLAQKESAIVTDIPGTTRDVIREHINIDGMPVHIVDTAGLRHSDDVVEQMGIERAQSEFATADAVLFLVDSIAEGKSWQDYWPESTAKPPTTTPVILVHTKADLNQSTVGLLDAELHILAISAMDGCGLPALKEHLKLLMGYQQGEGTVLARRRHVDALQRARGHTELAKQQLLNYQALELAAEELRLAHECLGEITGKMTSDDLLGEIFSSFCIGK